MTATPKPADDPLEEARHTAAAAARHAGIEVVDVHGPADARAVAALFDAVWGRDRSTGQVLTPEALTALAHSGCQVSLARPTGASPRAADDGEVVAATAAWLGRDPATGQVTLHSHATGVRAGWEGRGIGRAMKWYQRAWALEHGIATVRWTFDPLIRRNAVLNLALLGASAAAYHVDLYGPMTDARNHALPTDRVTAVWELAAPRVRAAASGRAATPDVAALRAAGAEIALAIGADGGPVRQDTDVPRQLLQIPPDIEQLRAERAEVALAWTHAIRTPLGRALDSGARIGGVSRDGWYVLAARDGIQELATGAGRRPDRP